jgi:hypothetical protein
MRGRGGKIHEVLIYRIGLASVTDFTVQFGLYAATRPEDNASG